MNNIIETNRLTCRYGSKDSVNDLSLTVTSGSIFAFIGPNGAGKTTTIKMLMNLIKPTGGSASILGLDSKRLGCKELAQIGYVSENQLIPDWMTVEQLMNYCKPMYPTWDEVFSKHLLTKFKLPLNRHIKKLSRGMKMKAQLASSLAYRPKLLVLDEPFSGLDPIVRDEFIRGLLELSELESRTVFISSHDIDEVERLADTVGFINEGKMTICEEIDSLQTRFRKVEFNLSQPISNFPTALPKECVHLELAGQQVRFITNQYKEQSTQRMIREFFPDASSVTVSPMSLRDIFISTYSI